MNENQLVVEGVKNGHNYTKLILKGGTELLLRPFVYVKPADVLEFLPSFGSYKEIHKVFEDRATGEIKKIRLHPPYEKKETIYLPPHQFEVTFRERKDSKDWDKVR